MGHGQVLNQTTEETIFEIAICLDQRMTAIEFPGTAACAVII